MIVAGLADVHLLAGATFPLVLAGAALIPALKIGGGFLASWLGSKAAKKGLDPTKVDYSRSPESQSAYDRFTAVGDEMTAAGRPLLQGAGGYYDALLRGSQSAMNAAVAPERQQITSTYRGAEKGAQRLRGPARDRALMELNKQRAGQIGALPFAARANAASQAGQLGLSQAGMGASIYDRALGSADRRKEFEISDIRDQDRLKLYGAEQSRQAGQDWGKLFGTIMSTIGGPKGGGGIGGSLPPIQGGAPWSVSPYAAAVQPRRP